MDQAPGSGAVPGAMGLVVAAFVIVLGVTVVVGLARWVTNNASPLLETPAQVVAKRERVSGGGQGVNVSTSYFVTFEKPDGERVELRVRGPVYGGLAEGDRGRLTHQGTRFVGFDRSR